MSKLQIVAFKPEYISYFDHCNREWLEELWTVEPIDEALFSNPQGLIIDKGGYICFAALNDEIIGTCALFNMGNDTYELAKMGVLKKARGNKAGRLLAEHCIEKAREFGAKKIMLLSNTANKAAIILYEKLGFHVTHLGPHPKYQRANIEMELAL